jgi:hypothetical protein
MIKRRTRGKRRRTLRRDVVRDTTFIKGREWEGVGQMANRNLLLQNFPCLLRPSLCCNDAGGKVKKTLI